MRNNPLYRPPAEANSLILQIDQGCPYNRCSFCGMYRGMQHQRMPLDQITALIAQESRQCPDTRRIFLADGDVMRRPVTDLQQILTILNEHFPHLVRVSVYANGSSIDARSETELEALRKLKLHTLYMGLESGDETILKACRKGETAAQMTEAGLKAQRAGLRMSVMVLLGLGGVERSRDHALHTAQVLNRMQPRLLSALRVIPVPGTELHAQVARGAFQPLTEEQVVEELRLLLSALELTATVFRANHSSNVIPLEGRLSRDKGRLVAGLDALLAADMLDKTSPGATPMWL